MSTKIFNAIWGVALIIFAASLAFIMGASYSYFSTVQKQQLKIETQLAAQGVTLNGMNYFDGLEDGRYRITWIASDGTVLYDNEADTAEMENHLEREEVEEALATGYGDASRYSKTLSERLLYAAELLPDGTVIRVSSNQLTVWALLLGFGQQIAIVVLLTLGISFFLASRLSKKIVDPINQIDPEKPGDYIGKTEVKEIEPLLRKMSTQQVEIKRNQVELEKTSQIRQEFTANASHELKTPLQTISGYAELLENGMVKPEDVKPFAGKIRKEAQRMTQLVGDIIDLTRLDRGSEGLNWEDTDLMPIAQNALDSIQQEADDKKVTLSLKAESATLHGVPQLLYSIVYNLCDNAVKYNKEGGKVEVKVINGQEEVKLIVKDTGIGIPEEDQSRIFERFYRVDKGHSKEIGGTGLGLSIVKHGAMIHQAKVSVDSKEGEGTTFMVLFPKNAAEIKNKG